MTSVCDWNKVAFAARLEEVIGELAVTRFAKNCEIAEGMLRKYLREESIPGGDKLVRISEAGGVSLLWLATGSGPKYPPGWDQITPSQLAVVLEFERYAQQKPSQSLEQQIQSFLDQYNKGLLEVSQVGDIGQISKDELLMWRDLAWERQAAKISVDEGILQASIEIADELLVTTARSMEPAKKSKLIAAIYQLNATTEGGVERSVLLNLLRLIP